MKIKILLVLIISTVLCKEPNNLKTDVTFITFSNSEGVSVIGEGVDVYGSKVTIKKPGVYLAQGSMDDVYILIKESSVDLLLQNVQLSSTVTAPIIVDSNLEDITITNVQNVTLIDYEDPLKTVGECSVIKIRKNSHVKFQNQGYFMMNGNCNNIIKGEKDASITFEKSSGTFILNGKGHGIATDGYLEFNGGTFSLKVGGDGIKCKPDEIYEDNGKILINDGTFNVECTNDAFTATTNITIVTGVFNIKTEKGHDSKTFNKSEDSAKGFKLSNEEKGKEIKILGGNFYLDTADDAFHSKRDLNIYKGVFVIYAGDDGLHAEYNLVLGEKDGRNDDLNLKVLTSYEAIEGMTITIYSGKINVTAEDDGLNGAGGNGGDMPWPGPDPGPGPGPGPRPGPWPPGNDSDDDPWPFPPRNDSDDWPPFPGNRGNDSYKISIHGGEIYVFCDGDGLDTNGNIFIHGGDLNVFSQGNRDNEPIDHDGNFTLFDGTVLGVGSQGIEKIHDGIKKGNEMYAYFAGAITKNQVLKIRDEKNNIVKEGNITKDINYIFFSSLSLNENYSFSVYDQNNVEKKLAMTFGRPASGPDDDEGKDWSDDDKEDHQQTLNMSVLGLLLLAFLF